METKILKSDRGGEHFLNDFSVFCEEQGSLHLCSAPYTPQQNGFGEGNIRSFSLCLFAEMLVFLVLDLSFRCTVSRRRKKSVIICYNER